MLRKEISYLKLTLVIMQVLVLFSFTPLCYLLSDIGAGLAFGPIGLFVLFALHGYAYIECSKNRLPKLSHLIGFIAVAFQINIIFYLLSILFLIIEAYPILKPILMDWLDKEVN